jgi:hypothetical protein
MFSETGIEGDKETSSALSRLDFIVTAALAVIVVVMWIWGMV